jgi:hypothetical protein
MIHIHSSLISPTWKNESQYGAAAIASYHICTSNVGVVNRKVSVWRSVSCPGRIRTTLPAMLQV